MRTLPEDPINIGQVIIDDGTEYSSEVPTHNITDNQNHHRLHTDDSDNTINKAMLILHNTYLCINYFAINLPARYDPQMVTL